MDLLKFITCGSVDDGKSTLIGRLLYDSRAVSPDILAAIERQSKNKQNGEIDLALLTDGLRSEREQGITIDVAYKYFSTARRKIHHRPTRRAMQYTRNMITSASNSEAAIILIDARQGVIEQTRRHSIIASLLGLPHVVVCINKMDLVDFSQTVYDRIVADYQAFRSNTDDQTPRFYPVSALQGDNVAKASTRLPWYKGPTLLDYLETVEVARSVNAESAAFPGAIRHPAQKRGFARLPRLRRSDPERHFPKRASRHGVPLGTVHNDQSHRSEPARGRSGVCAPARSAAFSR